MIQSRPGGVRANILQQGLDLTSSQGFTGLTLGHLATRAGMSKSGLFAHFGSKQELTLALLEHNRGVFEREVIEPSLRSRKALSQLKTIVERWFGWSTKAGLSGGCPVASAFFEFDDDPAGPVRDKILAIDRDWRVFLQSLVDHAVENGELRAHLDADRFVWELCGLYLSHHVASRFVRDPKADDRSRELVRSLFARSATARNSRRSLQ